VQVRVVRRLPDLRETVPDERVTVRREALVLRRLCLKKKVMRRSPLLRCEIEWGRAMRNRDDDAASRKYVWRVARVPRRGVQAEGVLKAHVSRAELGQIAEDAVVLGHFCILARPPKIRTEELGRMPVDDPPPVGRSHMPLRTAAFAACVLTLALVFVSGAQAKKPPPPPPSDVGSNYPQSVVSRAASAAR
jgi:hypothetical protein